MTYMVAHKIPRKFYFLYIGYQQTIHGKAMKEYYQELMTLVPSNMVVEFDTLPNTRDTNGLVNPALVRNLL